MAPAGSDPDAATSGPEAVARTICLRLLARRAHSRAELAAALARRGVPDGAATAALDRLAELRLVDDAEFAQAWVASRRRGAGLGRAALGAELRRRGVAIEVVAEALGDGDDVGERDRARALAVRRLSGLRGVASSVQARRLVAMLQRKGYPPGLSYGVVRELLGAVGADDPDLPLD